MDLRKIIRGEYESLFYCNTTDGGVTNQKTCELLGFKEGIPVLSDPGIKQEMPSPSKTLSPARTLTVEVNRKTMEKYVNLNGKKLRMVPESELPIRFKQGAQLLKMPGVGGKTANPTAWKVVKMVKVIGGNVPLMFNALVKKDASQITDTSVNKSDNGNNIQLSHETLIRDSKPTLIKIPSAGTGGGANGGVVGSSCVVVKGSLPQTGVNHGAISTSDGGGGGGVSHCPNSIIKMNPLDLSKVSKVETIKREVTKADKSVETNTPRTVERSSQTVEEDLLMSGLNTDFWNFFSSDTPMAVVSPADPLPTSGRDENVLNFFRDVKCSLNPDNNGNMLIHIGVLRNDIHLVKKSCTILKLLKRSVDIPNHGDFTALQLAILNDCSPQIVKTLLDHGAGLEVEDSEGNNILHLAVENKRTEVLDILLRFADQPNFNLDNFNAEGLTPLMICCCYNLLQCADLFIKYDADVNVRDRKSGRTALFHAAENYNFEMVKLLLNNNADTKIKNFFGTSPHDAMYEVDDVPDCIKNAILGKSSKRKNVEEVKPVNKVRRTDETTIRIRMGEGISKLKTYARPRKIESCELRTFFPTIAN
ncbi:hypothetical protein NQ315_002376 [Exocentrus adspersus]|uniref:Uncharacterized protein n=1 Tax=Exocentrus adspersus TaxID=1586481 RepID=A0AAV8VTI6_9CUCU|nr:hypothetical protein NQ315_002376 [Exocentrus adspersus]